MGNPAAHLRLQRNPWVENSHVVAAWTAESQSLLKQTLQQLSIKLTPFLKASCTHTKGNGGVKGAARWITRKLPNFQFVARFDIASYYQNIRHDILLSQITELRVDQPLQNIVRDYLQVPDLKGTGGGMVAGGSLSPLLGALYLLPLDYAMQQYQRTQKVFYVRYMDDILILSKTRWQLRSALKTMYSVTGSLALRMHCQDKRFIGRTSKSFDFLGYHFQSGQKLRPSAESLRRLVERARRLYKQKGDIARLWRYVARWVSYIWGGLKEAVCLDGRLNTYWQYVLANVVDGK